ncbi:MAG TPA: septum formation initiator family protein, partial [Actinotalea sp.]|nr:septum formation initiator family protein [Actinotalea sp.]
SRAVRTGGGTPGGVGEPDQAGRGRSIARLLSVRAMVLGVVLLVSFSMLFPTVRAYLGQRAELDALAAQVVAAEQREEQLATDLDRWGTDAYVAAQARERLSFVLPGETAYRVIDPEVVVEQVDVESQVPGGVTGPALPPGGAVAPWYATVWESVQLAGAAAVPTGAPDQAAEDTAEVPVEPSSDEPPDPADEGQ